MTAGPVGGSRSAESGRPPLPLTDDEVLTALAALDARWVG